MKEYRIHMFRYFSVFDVIYKENLRDEFSFLRDTTSFNNKIKLLLDNKFKERDIDSVFIHNYGQLKWDINKDGLIYFRSMQHLVSENEPFRPFVPISTHVKKCKHLEGEIKEIYNSGCSVSLYPQLIFEVRKSFSVSLENADKLDKIISKVKQHFFKLEKRDKKNLLKSIFTSKVEPFSKMSDVFILIESTVDNYKQTNFLSDIFEAHRLSKLWIKKILQNRWLLIYGNPSPHKKQRIRTLKVFQVCNMLTVLRSEILRFLNSGKENELEFFSKIELFELILSVLNVDFYSSTKNPTYYFPKSYQRITFQEILTILKKTELFKEVEKRLIDSFKRWDAYLQTTLIKRNNIPVNCFKQKIKFKVVEKEEPTLSDEEELMLDYLIYLYKEKQPNKVEYVDYLKDRKLKGFSLNKLVENFSQYKGEKNVSITVRALRGDGKAKGYIPDFLYSLAKKKLIIITPQEKGRTRRLYALNIENPYVLNLLNKKI
ncbi:MAG: hypothetical protein K9W46_04310 [Candidatus Heimdallarchaeum endolithica]|uniref:Uncharacterized protein n=1 Tax=Candidatus Heimdallarchaeum endolithica TaxID=2876572 RepID=A0A9Y1BSH3_9ARCH|nr:MAG: hypothetical protein K9W46_04310 [Candidatus Heimdallarchaeum endolithica]